MKPLVWITGLISVLGAGAAIANITTDSLNQTGIDALRLNTAPYNLTGRKIAIGQIEVGRPGQFGLDKAVSNLRSTTVAQVFYRNQPAKSNRNVDAHAMAVAGLMVGTAKALPGIAPQARLYSAAAGVTRRSGQPQDCSTAQHIAQQNGGDVRAINFSFGESLRHDPRSRKAVLDGNALLTQCLDWSAREHDVLYLVAGNQGKGGIPIPTDTFNNMVIASSMRVKGVFTKVDYANISDPHPGIAARIIGMETNVGLRRSVSLIAPGNQIGLWSMNNQPFRESGTSFAAPHVTATIALLQEYGDRQLRQKRPNWSTDSRRHQVMKAVLMNAAEKLKDEGNGLKLGMSRTILTKTNRTWLDSDAHQNWTIPLDAQMGTGQLNALRAYQQYSPGQRGPSQRTPAIAWDYRSVSTQAPYQEYVFEKPLRQGSYVAITLAWDRHVDLMDTNRNGQYDVGETFRDQGLNNLDLYLMRAEEHDAANSIGTSTSRVDSVEHLFHPIPQTSRYKIRVQFRQRSFAYNASTQPYGLAWWTVAR
jgi:hypothetical protein